MASTVEFVSVNTGAGVLRLRDNRTDGRSPIPDVNITPFTVPSLAENCAIRLFACRAADRSVLLAFKFSPIEISQLGIGGINTATIMFVRCFTDKLIFKTTSKTDDSREKRPFSAVSTLDRIWGRLSLM